jgi:hypothetical protein
VAIVPFLEIVFVCQDEQAFTFFTDLKVALTLSTHPAVIGRYAVDIVA